MAEYCKVQTATATTGTDDAATATAADDAAVYYNYCDCQYS